DRYEYICANTRFFFYLFFFSSRRRHTILQGDWSSDVCSSDLCGQDTTGLVRALHDTLRVRRDHTRPVVSCPHGQYDEVKPVEERSEERRVGKECRSRWWGYH